MSIFERLVELYMTVVFIIGGYQFYFWAQRQRFFPAKYLETRFDGWIKYNPYWVWVYSGLYYPMIIIAAWTVPTWGAYAHVLGCYLVLLAIQVTFFITMPVSVPEWWREKNRAAWIETHGLDRSQRFMDLVWSYDKFRNSMPSMHVSVATVTDLTIWLYNPTFGHIGTLFPILIAISAIKTKQHYVVDVVPGAVLGAAVFFMWNWAVPLWT